LERRAELKVITFASKSALITAALYFWQNFGLYFHTFYPGCFSSQQGSLACLNFNKITICFSYIAQLLAANVAPISLKRDPVG
jgi:hypothetical protein